MREKPVEHSACMSELIVDKEHQRKGLQKATIPSLSIASCIEIEGNYHASTIGSQLNFLDSNSLLIQPLSLNQVSAKRKRS
jgi:hypothetical protein